MTYPSFNSVFFMQKYQIRFGVLILHFFFFLIFSITSCSKTDQSSPIEEKTSLKVSINANEPIIDLLSTATLQKKDGSIIYNYINRRELKFITFNFSTGKREEIKFEIEGPNSLGFKPLFFYRNTANEIIALSNSALCALCEIKSNTIQLKQRIGPDTNLWLPSQHGFRASLEQNNIVFWNLEDRELPKLSLLNIENFKFKQINIPYNAEFLHPFRSKTIMTTDYFLPFVSISNDNFIFSNWYSPDIYLLSKNKQFEKRKLSLYNCENDLASFFDSIEGAINAEYQKKAHGPVMFLERKKIYISENYYIPEKTSILVNLNTSGKEIFSLKERDNARHQKFWLGDQLAILFINEEKNFLELKIYE